jgi:Iap family predicted aminopeptidase
MKESVNRVYKGAVLSSALFGGICLLLLVPSLLGSEGAVARESDPRETIRALSALGQKRVGTPACSQAGDWLAAKFRKIGLENVHFEPFRLPLQIVTGSTLALEVDGAARPFSHLALVGSGVGDVQAAPVWVNHAKPEDLRGKDLTHKIAVVRRDPNYDRAQQLFNVANARAAAMLYISDAPRGQIQVGSVLRTFEPTTRIPAVSISRNDGDAVEALIRQGRVRQVHMAVAATVSPLSRPAIGRNVVGTIPGVDPRHQIIFGAHYDTHLYGAVDNESGVAVLVGLAQQLVEFYRSSGRRPAYTLVFVGYDGEEIALYGGYSYLRHHYFMAHEAILAAINFEMPVGMNPRLDKEFPAFAGRKDWGIACSDVPVLKQVFAAARTNEL